MIDTSPTGLQLKLAAYYFGWPKRSVGHMIDTLPTGPYRSVTQALSICDWMAQVPSGWYD